MTNHRLSIEQKFQLEAAFRDIDACDDIGKLREITKAIITAQENEKAFAREAISRMRQEIEAQAKRLNIRLDMTKLQDFAENNDDEFVYSGAEILDAAKI